jgi:predicted amidohydrolase
MKLCAAQTKPIKGAIEQNTIAHIKMIELAIANEVDFIVFPELSLTGYEPELAKELATTVHDNRLDIFQQLSNANAITIIVGLPTISDMGIHISAIIFQAHKPRQLYSKQFLHTDEDIYFTPGSASIILKQEQYKIALAICYELSVSAHATIAAKNEATVYIASVLNSVQGVDKDINRLAAIAKEYGMLTLMANYVGVSGGYTCAGKTSIWNTSGKIIGQLDDVEQSLLIVDTDTMQVKTISL